MPSGVFARDRVVEALQAKAVTYKAGHVLPVLRAKNLLGSGRHQAVLQQVQEMSGLDKEDFSRTYQATLDRFVEFVQILPTHNHAPLSGLLNESIARATYALRTYQLAHKNKPVDPLMHFAVFTAGLFTDVSKVVTNQKITIVDEEGNYQADWHPFGASLAALDAAEYYKIYPLAPIYLRLDVSITPLLARQLMPEEAFLWISRHLSLFADWLDALRGDTAHGGRLATALALIRREDILALMESLVPVNVDQKESPNTKHGEAFYSWLKTGLENSDIKINTADAGVHVVEGGVFLDPSVFQDFVKIYNAPVNMNVVQTQFGNMMGFTKEGGNVAFNQYFSEYPTAGAKQGGKSLSGVLSGQQKTLRTGMLLGDPATVFMNAQMPAQTPLMQAAKASVPASHQLPSRQKVAQSSVSMSYSPER